MTSQHPLFAGDAGQRNDSPGQNALVPIGRLQVLDFQLGAVPIRETPHFFFARDLVAGRAETSSGALYKAYRKDQFGFSEKEASIDLEYFRSKIMNPRFDLAITIERAFWHYRVTDGFHRLAIYAAYSKHLVQTIRARR